MPVAWALRLPLARHEALLLRRVLETNGKWLREEAAVSRGLSRDAELFAADELKNIRMRLEGLMLKGAGDA